MAKGQHPLLRAGSQVVNLQVTVSVDLKPLYYSVTFIAYTKLANMATGRMIQPGGPRAGDPWRGSEGETGEWSG